MTNISVREFRQATYVFAQAVAALARIEGMKAFNQERQNNGYSLGYSEDAFEKIIEDFGLGHNSVMTILNGQDAP